MLFIIENWSFSYFLYLKTCPNESWSDRMQMRSQPKTYAPHCVVHASSLCLPVTISFIVRSIFRWDIFGFFYLFSILECYDFLVLKDHRIAVVCQTPYLFPTCSDVSNDAFGEQNIPPGALLPDCAIALVCFDRVADQSQPYQ